jgi:methyl-accepting chemotaxis protein
MMSIFADDVTVLVWQVIAPTKMDPLNFTAGVYPYPLTVADMAVNTPPANPARPPAVSTTAEVRVTLASSSLGSSVLGRKRGRDDIEEDVQTRKSDVQTRKSAGSTRSAASTRERERVMEEAAKNMSAAAAKMREAAETKEKVGKNMSAAAAKMREATEKKEKVELWQKQMEELDEEADGLYEEGEELFEAAKRSGDVTE